MRKVNNLKGNIFGKLTVLELSHIDKYAYWNCLCSCGKETIVRGTHLTSGNSTSCGCSKGTPHGDHGTPLYLKWAYMKQRVSSDDVRRSKYYKGRGITVCNRWNDYINFKEDMLLSYNVHVMLHGARETTLERKDNDYNYCLDNCCWATPLEQANNRRCINDIC